MSLKNMLDALDRGETVSLKVMPSLIAIARAALRYRQIIRGVEMANPVSLDRLLSAVHAAERELDAALDRAEAEANP
jgi:hypothetical protein